MDHFTEIIVAALNAPLLLLVVKQFYDNRKLKRRVADLTPDLKVGVREMVELYEVGKEMLSETKADRFLMLAGSNGKEDFRVTSVIYEQHSDTGLANLSIGAIKRFQGFEFDRAYLDMLKSIEHSGEIFYDVDQMRDSDLKSIYQGEQVHHSSVWFLRRIPIDAHNDFIIYCSLATHQPKQYTDIEKVKLKVGVDRVRLLAKSIFP